MTPSSRIARATGGGPISILASRLGTRNTRTPTGVPRDVSWKIGLAIVAITVGIARADRTSMKGWEVYSWSDRACAAGSKHEVTGAETVCFALLPGTNRMKGAAEIKKTPLKLAEIERKLEALDKGEEVFWTVGDTPTSNQFDQPTKDASDPRQQLVHTIGRLGLKLSITPRPPDVGTISMAADRTIELRLRSRPPGPIAETLLRYRPGDARYREMIGHVGGLSPGETKLVPPWPAP